MNRRKPTAKPPEPPEVDRDDFAARPLNRKQVQEMIRKRERLVDADLRGCDLSGLNFDGLDLSMAKLGEANLSRATFRNAVLRGTSFFGASLKDATLEDCDLEDADFDYAWLDGVSLRGAKIRKAIFPLRRLSLVEIKESVRSGKRLKMDPIHVEDED